MALANVELSNTFNEFRLAHNDAATTINNLQDGGTLSIDVDVATIATANITSVDSSLVPAANLTYDLGSPTNWWNDLYLSGDTIFLGTSQIKVENDSVKFLLGGEEVFSAEADGSIPAANVITANDIVTNTIDANTVTINDLTAGRVVVVGTDGLVTDDSGLTFNTSTDALSVAGAVDAGSLSTTTTLDVGTDLTVTGNTTLSTNLDVTGTLDVGGVATFTSNVAIAGDLLVTGNTVTFDVETKSITDSLIYLAANNYFSDLVDIGFIGHYYDGIGNNHTGVIRHATDGKIYLFTGYGPEIEANNVIDVNDPTFEPASIVAGNAELDYITANGITATLTGNVTATTITVNDYTLPAADGSANQIFITDGAGNVSFTDLPAGFTTGKAIAMAIVFG